MTDKVPNKVRKNIDDLGVAAYLRMHGYKVIGRKGKSVYFEIDETESDEFNRRSFDYVNSPFHEFDSHIMSLKKIREYLPE